MEKDMSVVLGKLDLQRFANALRGESMAWQNARAEFDLIQEVRLDDIGVKHKDYSEVTNVMSRAMCLLGKLGSGNALCKPSFILDYDLRCNLLGNAKYGADECIGLSFAVRWEKRLVKVHFVHSNSNTSLLNGGLESLINSRRVRGDLKKFAKCTGLQFDEVRNKSSEVGTLVKVFQTVKIGHNKMARLVKGCLLYLDRCDGERLVVDRFNPCVVKYNCEGLVESYKEGGVAYVWNGDNDSMAYSIVLYSMCEQYPHPVFGGMEYISIPSDGEVVKMVSYDAVMSDEPIEVTQQVIWGALVKYCDLMGISDDLEEAMIIACSLRENRYLSKVSLPAVVSHVDLVYPALADPKISFSNHTRLNLASAIIIGRAHQMMCLTVVRDVEVCARATEKTKEGALRTVRSFISRNNWTLLNYMDDKSQIDLLKKTRSMVWLNYLTDSMIVEMRKYSIFESLWLIKYPGQVLRDGVIRCLKKGEKNPIGIHRPGLYFDAYSTLLKEIEVGGFLEHICIPDGGFNVRFACITCEMEEVHDLEFDGEEYHPFEFQHYADACEDTAHNEDMMGMGWEICSDEFATIPEGDEKCFEESDEEKDEDESNEEEESEPRTEEEKEPEVEERAGDQKTEEMKAMEEPKEMGPEKKSETHAGRTDHGSTHATEVPVTVKTQPKESRPVVQEKNIPRKSDPQVMPSPPKKKTTRTGVGGTPVSSSKSGHKVVPTQKFGTSDRSKSQVMSVSRVQVEGKEVRMNLPPISVEGPALRGGDVREGFGTGLAPEMDKPGPTRKDNKIKNIRTPELVPEESFIEPRRGGGNRRESGHEYKLSTAKG